MRAKRAFTLVELLVVISIIALLISILLPSLKKARWQAKFALCANNQRQVVSAATLYATDNSKFPPAITQNRCIDARGRFWAKPSWINYNANDAGCAANGGAVWPYLGDILTGPDVFVCPLSPGPPHIMDETYQSANTKFLHASFYLLWNYRGFEAEGYYGPSNMADQRGGQEGKMRMAAADRLLTADRLEWNDPEGSYAWDSTHRFVGGNAHRAETISIYTKELVSAVSDPDTIVPKIRNNAGYLDCHVAPFETTSAVGMPRKLREDTRVYLPRNAVPVENIPST